MACGFDISPGGKGSNAAVAAARQGARVALVARIGDDDFGRMGLSLWRAEGIETRHVVQAPGERSGVAQILVYDDGDNSIAVAPGAGARLDASHVHAAADAIRQARVVVASCEVPQSATFAAFRIARTAGVATVLNPAPATPLSDALLALCDVLTPNETELHALAGGSARTPAQAALQLQRRGARAVIVTLGARGCELFQPDAPPVAWPGVAMTVADTIGAGDTFTGALAAALARGDSLQAAAPWANAAAALSVTRHGAITGMPDLAAVKRQLDLDGPG